MRIEVRSPTLPESVSEATLLSWHKHAGENVTRDENLVDIETEKVVLEVPAPQDGVLQQVLKRDGDVIGSNE
ncbi:MAG: biotin/lipoyl-containing protein, partial [Acidiferrobacterales bacterium]